MGCASDVVPCGVLLLLRNDDLDDADNTFVVMKDLNKFVKEASDVEVKPSNVQDIPAEDYDKIVRQFEEQLSLLRNDNELMIKKLEETEQKLRKMMEDGKVIIFYLSIHLFSNFFNVKCSIRFKSWVLV